MCHAKCQTCLQACRHRPLPCPSRNIPERWTYTGVISKQFQPQPPLLNPLMNHEPTILCELFRDQFRALCKATSLAIGAVAKPVSQTEQSVGCNEPRQADSVLPHKKHWAKHSTFFPQHLQRKIQSKTCPRYTAENCTYSVDFKTLLLKSAVKLTFDHFLSNATSDTPKRLNPF